MKKTALTLILTLCFTIILASLPQVDVVKAENIIYIREDGSVEGTDKIQRDGDSYIFTGDIIGKIVLMKSGVTINGNGFTLTGYDGDS